MLVYNKELKIIPIIKSTAVKQLRHQLKTVNKSFLKSIGLKLKKHVTNK